MKRNRSTDTEKPKRGLRSRESGSRAVVLEPEVLPPEPEVDTVSGEEDEVQSATLVSEDAAVEVLPASLEDEVETADELESVGQPAKTSREVIPYDPFEAYLRELRTYPPLSKEDEHRLAVRYHQHKDLDAAYKLVTSNLWLVVKIARDYERAARGMLDLIQEGNIGLMEAVKNFDPYRGVRFPSYAVWWIRAYMVRFLIANWRMVKIGTTQAQRKLFFNLKKEKERLEREGFFPTPALLADKLNVKESEVVEMEQRLGSSDVSVDAPLQAADTESTLLSVLPAQEQNPEELLGARRIRHLISKGLDEFSTQLNSKEQIIFRERMLAEDKATLQDIAEKLSLSRERVRQIENRVREKLKSYLARTLGTEIEELEF